MKTRLFSILILLTLLCGSAAFAQQSTTAAPNFCTKEMAYQTVGKWGKQKKDDLVMADHTFPKEQFKPVLLKMQKVVDLFMKASPEFKGIEAHVQRTIRGDSYAPNGALSFRLDIGYGGYICVGNSTYKVEDRGKIILYGGYGSTTVMFNSLRDVLERVEGFVTNDGDEIYEVNKKLGEFKGLPLIEPRPRDQDRHEAVIIAPSGRSPFKPVSREQFLTARIRNYQKLGGFVSEIAALNSALANLSAAERNSPAIVSDFDASPQRKKLFATEIEGGKKIVTIDKSFFAKSPRDAIQLITVHWSWKDTDPPKKDAILQFKQTFDFEALKQMIGK